MKITFRAVIEVIGKPKEHIEESMKGYVDKIKADENYQVKSEEIAEIKKQDGQDLWAIFAEMEIETEDITNLTSFCFDYMPSIMEIIAPVELKFSGTEFSEFLNDLQAKLHQVDLVAKQLKLENDHLKINLHRVLKNYVTVLLRGRKLTSDQLSKLMGVIPDKLEDFLDELIDEGRIDLKEGMYFLKSEENGN